MIQLSDSNKINKTMGIIGENAMTIMANYYGTDKGTKRAQKHGYTEYYGRILDDRRSSVRSVLEIGIFANGPSLRMWRDFFFKAMIYGADIEIDYSIVPDDKRIEVVRCDQSNRESLSKLKAYVSSKEGNIDIIIDDGSHKMLDQQITLDELFDAVSAGGVYIIEDLQSSKWGSKFGVNEDESNSTLAMVRSIIDGSPRSEYIDSERMLEISSQISSVEMISPKGDESKSLSAMLHKK